MPQLIQHAPPDSLPGFLQRGRGEGYRRLLSVPKSESWPLLTECISNDPRLDSQIESRAEYYASIALKVDLDLSPLVDYLHQNDDVNESGWNTPLAVDTLDQLAARGDQKAAEILLDYLHWG
jgi:hypothetical protein